MQSPRADGRGKRGAPRRARFRKSGGGVPTYDERQPPVGGCRSYRRGTYGSVSRIWSARRGSAGAASGRRVIYLGRPLPGVSSGLPAPSLKQSRWQGPPCRLLSAHGATWPCTPWGLPGRSRHRDRRCALTAPFHPLPIPARAGRAGLLSVARAFHPRPDKAERRSASGGGSLPVRKHGPCGVRTFLTADADGCRHRRSDTPIRTSNTLNVQGAARIQEPRGAARRSSRKRAAARAAGCAG